MRLLWVLTLTTALASANSVSGGGQDPGSAACSNIGYPVASCILSSSGGVIGGPSVEGIYSAVTNPGVSVYASSESMTYQSHLTGWADAFFSDTLVFTGGNGPGTVIFSLAYGASSSSDIGGTGGNMSVSFNSFSRSASGGSPGFFGTRDVALDMVFGSPFQIFMSASAYSSATGHEHDTSIARLTVTGMQVLGGDGAALSTFHFNSDANASVGGIAPEPGALVLSGSALALLLLIRRLNFKA